MKERNKFLSIFNEIFKLKIGLERVVLACLLILISCHISACLWYFLNNLEGEDGGMVWALKYNFMDADNADAYAACFYLIVQTVVTVGYGDLKAQSTNER